MQGVGAGIVIVLSCVAGRFLYVVCMFHECLVDYRPTNRGSGREHSLLSALECGDVAAE